MVLKVKDREEEIRLKDLRHELEEQLMEKLPPNAGWYTLLRTGASMSWIRLTTSSTGPAMPAATR